MYKDWKNSILQQVMSIPEFEQILQENGLTNEQKQEIEEIIEERVSYKSLFQLHQIVDNLAEEN